jgi:hypothetical protein
MRRKKSICRAPYAVQDAQMPQAQGCAGVAGRFCFLMPGPAPVRHMDVQMPRAEGRAGAAAAGHFGFGQSAQSHSPRYGGPAGCPPRRHRLRRFAYGTFIAALSCFA